MATPKKLPRITASQGAHLAWLRYRYGTQALPPTSTRLLAPPKSDMSDQDLVDFALISLLTFRTPHPDGDGAFEIRFVSKPLPAVRDPYTLTNWLNDLFQGCPLRENERGRPLPYGDVVLDIALRLCLSDSNRDVAVIHACTSVLDAWRPPQGARRFGSDPRPGPQEDLHLLRRFRDWLVYAVTGLYKAPPCGRDPRHVIHADRKEKLGGYGK